MTARPAPTSALFHNNEYTIATTVFVMVGVGVTIFPGALLGAGLAILVWRVSRPSIVATWLLGVLGAATAAMFWSALVPGWPWHLLLAWAQGASSGLTPWAVLQSVAGEALLGPLLVASAQFGLAHAARTIQGQEWLRTREMASRKKALERGWTGPQTTNGAAARPSRGHMRLGAVAEDQRPFDLSIEELSQHVFLPGASGSGKTTTIARIADGALANGYGVVIVDCKGSGLGGVARSLAERHKLPFTLVDPRDPDTAGYDPCSGDAAAIANKLIGALASPARPRSTSSSPWRWSRSSAGRWPPPTPTSRSTPSTARSTGERFLASAGAMAPSRSASGWSSWRSLAASAPPATSGCSDGSER